MPHTASDSFHEEILMHRNGTHGEALGDPIIHALKELCTEVDNVITGFESLLRRIQRNGERAFDAANNSEGSSETKPGEEPAVPIQPVANEEPIPHIITGKSSERVVEALKEVPLEGWAASKQKSDEVYAHEEL